ncbi:MAG: conjugal transfer protein TraI [Cyclobacteriaceae bacterium]|nr:conjugal transfer protein TraI [Cyclobacteriaceae bacterium]
MKHTNNNIAEMPPSPCSAGSGRPAGSSQKTAATLKKSGMIILICIMVLTNAPIQHARAAVGILEVIRQGVKKVIKAVDLRIQRLQNRTIGLQNAAKVLENKLAQLKLSEIATWTQRQRELYRQYYDELWKVRNTLAAYQRIKQILQRQQQIVEEYRFTWHMINQDKHFTRAEIDYMYRVYTGILNESVHNLDQILLVINAFKTQMSDGKRLEVINKAGDNIEQNYVHLQQFNNQNIQLSLNRAKDEHELETVKKLYGIE